MLNKEDIKNIKFYEYIPSSVERDIYSKMGRIKFYAYEYNGILRDMITDILLLPSNNYEDNINVEKYVLYRNIKEASIKQMVHFINSTLDSYDYDMYIMSIFNMDIDIAKPIIEEVSERELLMTLKRTGKIN